MFGENADEERGQVGIGTLIVFIAMVLVAAIAAGVLINTAGMLQSQAEATGEESTDLVSERIDVTSAIGEVDNNGEEFEDIRLNIAPAAGADDIDMTETIVQAVGPNGQANLVYGEGFDIEDGDPVLSDDNGDIVLTFNPAQDPFGEIDDPEDVGTVEGTVDDGEDPVSGALVGIAGQTAVTDSDGEYSISNVQADTDHDLVVIADEFDTAELSVNANGDETLDEQDISLDEATSTGTDTFAGTVEDDEENPVKGVTVGVQGEVTETDEDGEFELTDLEGTGDVGVIASGYEANVDGETTLSDQAAEISLADEPDIDMEAFGAGDEATLDIVSPSGATTSIQLNAPDLLSGGEAVRL